MNLFSGGQTVKNVEIICGLFFPWELSPLNFWCFSCVATLLRQSISRKKVNLYLEHPAYHHMI